MNRYRFWWPNSYLKFNSILWFFILPKRDIFNHSLLVHSFHLFTLSDSKFVVKINIWGLINWFELNFDVFSNLEIIVQTDHYKLTYLISIVAFYGAFRSFWNLFGIHIDFAFFARPFLSHFNINPIRLFWKNWFKDSIK